MMKISYVLPDKVLTNEELEKFYDSSQWTASKIFRKTGIKKRHVVNDEIVSDLAVAAAEKFFSEHGIDRSSVDFLLLCTQSPDYFLPTTACIVQDRLGLKTSCGALDFNLGCSGFVYGLALAKGLLLAKIARNVLLITAETYTRHIHPFDRSIRTIFSDAGAVALIEENDVPQIGEFVLGTDGKGAKKLIIPTGGMANPRTEASGIETQDDSGNIRTDDNLYMNGPEIFMFTLQEIPSLVHETIKKNETTLEDIDFFVFHQANSFMLEALRDQIKIPKEKFCIDIEEQGNTVSATIPIAMRRAKDRGELRENMRVLIAGFGVGYSWGATIIKV